MNGFVVLLELWILLLVCNLIGRRLVNLLPLIMQRSIGFYIAPILGLSTLVLLATLHGWIYAFDFKITASITAIIAILAFIFENKKRILFKDSLYLCGFAFICALPVLAPIFRFGGFNPFTDIFTYLVQAQWLQDHAFPEKVITSGNFPAFTQVALYQETGSRMGGSFLLGYVQSLFNLKWSYYAYIATVAVSLVTGCVALGGVIVRVVPSRRIIVLALALLPSLMMNGYIYGAEWGFYPQTIGLSCALGVTAIFPYLVKLTIMHRYKLIKIVTTSLPLSVCAAALLFAYNEPFPIFVAAIFIFLFIVICQNLSSFKTLMLFLATFIAEVLILVNYEAIRIFINIYQTLGISHGLADIGWPVVWSPIQFLAFAFGMKSPFHSKFLSFDYFYSTFFAAIILISLLVTLIRFSRDNPKRRDNIIFLACVEFILLIFFIKFRYFAPDKSVIEVGHTFLQFKIAKYQAPFALSLLAIFALITFKALKHYRNALLGAYAVLFVVGTWFHYHTSAKNYTNHFLNSVEQRKNPYQVLLDLREALQDIPKDKIIYVDLGAQQSKLRQMVAYILYDRKIASDYRDDGYILGRLPEQDRNMSKEGAYKIIYMRSAVNYDKNNDMLVGPFVIKSPK